jgi:ubiquinol-cytochrome c reductase cytochrome c1 subunit
MKKLLIILMTLLPAVAIAAGGNVKLDKGTYDQTDKASLQRGAQLFMNYCFGCHQMQYQRYQRTFNDLGIPEKMGMENLMFTGEKVGEHMKNAMPVADGAKWFGAAPPDLTLVARVRTPDWVYTYLRSFYADDSRPFGVNNTVFPEVGMPHVLQDLQGIPVKATEKRMVDGEMVDMPVGLKATGGSLSAEEYDMAVQDLVNFLVYTGEPMILERESLGRWVIAFIIVFTIFAFLLKKEYWRDIH